MEVEDYDLGDQLGEVERRIFEHPGHKRHADLDAFALCLSEVFRANLLELVVLLEQAATDEMLAMELIQNVHDDAVRRGFHARTTQRLHNYLAGTLSVVDHSRRLMSGYSGPLIEEFDRRKRELLVHGEVRFMMDLRIFIQHYTLPVLAHSLRFQNVNTPEQAIDSEVELSVHALLCWENWTAEGRRFLVAQGDVVRLRPVVKRHGQLILDFNGWLFDALSDENEPALAEVNRLVVERNAVLIGGSLEDGEVYTERITADRQRPRLPSAEP